MSISKVQIQTTSACNARCGICPHKDFYGCKPVRVMSLAEFEAVMRFLKPLGKSLTRIVPYFQNEPFCDPEFFEKLDIAASYFPGIEFVVNTNLLLFKESYIDKVRFSPITHFYVSCLGHTPEKYRANMGVGGDSYEKLLGNLELLKRLENSRIKIGIDCHGVDIDPDEYRETFKRFGFPISVGKPYSRGGSIGPLKNYGVSYGCSFMDSRLLNWLHIRANGDIALCCMDYTNDYIMGNVYELKTLDRLFESEAFKRIQAQAAGKGQPDGFICQKCEFGIRIPPASAPAPAAPKAKPPVAPPVPPPRASAPFQLSSSLLKALTRGYGRVVLYGAGRIAKRLLEEGARKGWPRPDLIVDDVRKDGELCGVPIRNLADERLAEDDLIVLATDCYQSDMKKRLLQIECKANVVDLYD